MNRQKLKNALKDTFPIFISYFTLSLSFGIVAVQAGIKPFVVILMSIIIYSGALQFLLVAAYNKMGLIDLFVASFLLNFRQIFYSLTFLERYKGKFYKIFALTDETFAVLHDKNDEEYEFYVSVLNHLYWVGGTIVGVVLANQLDFKLKGLDFVLVCLFVVILLDQFLKRKRIFPYLLGVGSYLFFYVVGVSNVLLFSIMFSFVVIFLRNRYV